MKMVIQNYWMTQSSTNNFSRNSLNLVTLARPVSLKQYLFLVSFTYSFNNVAYFETKGLQ